MKDAPIQDADLYLAFQLMKRKDYEGAHSRILEGLKRAEAAGNEALQGVYLSALGVLYKLKKDYKKSYKFYQKAEKFLPEENSLKIISALLLIEEFRQFDTAIRKLDKVLQLEAHDPAMVHHATAVQGMAFFLMGKKDKAKACLERLLGQDFQLLRSASNLDFKMVELFLKKGFLMDHAKEYLEKALMLAQQKKEKIYENIIKKLLADFPASKPPAY